MKNDLSDKLSKILECACHEAMRTGSYEIRPEHLILGVIRHRDNLAANLMEESGLALDYLKRTIEETVSSETVIPYDRMEDMVLSPQIVDILGSSVKKSESEGREKTDSADLIVTLCKDWGNFPASDEIKGRILERGERLVRKSDSGTIPAESYNAIFSKIINNSKTLN